MERIEKAAESLMGVKDTGHSKSFQILIRQIGESKTKHEEDRIIKKEAVFLKETIGSPTITSNQMKEYLVRLVYCEMLGHDSSWGYIHAVKLTQSLSVAEKRMGYLASTLLLHEKHELNMLLVNTLQKDLKSANMVEVATALIVISKLIGAEMVPAVLPLVQEKLVHPKVLVRKKAVLAMQHFAHIDASLISHLENDFRRILSDPDPGVMEAALLLFHDLIKEKPAPYKDLVGSFVYILDQVISRKLPSEFDYHGVPAPWTQMRLLRILAMLGAEDVKNSELMYDVIEKSLASAESNSNIGQAITYECVRTVTCIYPNGALIEKVSHSVARLLVTANNNWRYLGIQALSQLVQVNPKYALDHQLVVIDCLDDADETLKRKTLDLLFKMTNPRNVTVISEKLISYLRTTTDEYIRADLVSKITQLAERFAPDNLWFIQTMNSVFELGGPLVRKEVAHNLMRLLAEGTDDEEADAELREDAVSTYVEMLDKQNIPDVLVQIICWVVSEYNYVLEDMDLEELLEKVTSLLHRKFQDATTYSWVVSAITKLVSQLGHMSDIVHSQLILHLSSAHTDIQQRCSELMQLSKEMTLMQKALPLDSACEDLEVDNSLSFLDDYVAMALSRGKSAYRPASQRVETVTAKEAPKTSAIKFEPYQLTTPSTTLHVFPAPVPEPISPLPRGGQQTPTSGPPETFGAPPDLTIPDSGIGLAAPKSRVWGKEGYKAKSNVSSLSAPVSVQEPPPSPKVNRDGGGVAVLQLSNLASSTGPSVVEAHATKEVNSQDQEKLNRANELFGGLSGPSKAPKGRRQRQQQSSPKTSPSLAPKHPESHTHQGSQDRQQPVQPVKPAPKPQVDLLLDLGDIDFSQPAAPLPQPIPQPSGQQMGLFGDLTIKQPGAVPITKATPIQATPPMQMAVPMQPTKPAVQSSDLLDLMGSTPPTISSSGAAPSSDFSFLNPQPPVPRQETAASMALSLFENPVGSLKVPAEYSRYPVVAGWDNKEVANDVRLRVSITKVLKPDQLVAVVFVANQKQDVMPDVALSFDVPSNLKASSGSGKADLTFTGNIAAFGHVHHVVSIVPISPAVNMSVRGQVTYKDRGSPKKLFFDITLLVSDLIRPQTYTTEEFGRKWVGLTNEKKLKVDGSLVKKPSEFMEVMSKKLNFHPVQIIGSEAIAAGNFLPGMTCLVHGKLSATSVELWVRTSSGLLTDSIAKLAQGLLQN